MNQVNLPSSEVGNSEALLDLLRKNQQHHIIDHWFKLPGDKKIEFFEETKKLNLSLVFDLYRKAQTQHRPISFSQIKPAQIISLPNSPEERAEREEARRLGEQLLQSQQVAVLIVSGGQGSRLGFHGPKGKFPISPIKKKSLFQIFAETLRALQIRYRATIPFLIMTNPENHRETRQFFEMNQYWGLSPENVFFFDQGMLPTLTLEGDLILRDETHLFTNPDGHGGSLKALFESGLLQMLMERKYSDLFYFQVDNPLVKIADPVFLGFHRKAKAEISTKVVRRTHSEEKVGIYLEIDGRPGIIEYSDFPPGEYQARDEKGQIRYWAGNTAIHVFSLSSFIG
jgi:UDP-N-acetylglucosamine/UDP-N-acetylgalactosamine diphosphorylase